MTAVRATGGGDLTLTISGGRGNTDDQGEIWLHMHGEDTSGDAYGWFPIKGILDAIQEHLPTSMLKLPEA